MDSLLLIASFITASTVIITAIIKLLKLFKSITTKITNFQHLIEENTRYTLKLVVINDDLDLDERLAAGKRYIDLGGNGYIHAVYDKLVKEEEQENDDRANKSIN